MLSTRTLQEIIRDWKKECGLTHAILFKYRDGILTICTDRPGPLIGLAGNTVAKYKEIFRTYDENFKMVDFIETFGIA